MKKEVECLSCKVKVEVTLVPYGDGHIATCPKCNQLAYNDAESNHSHDMTKE